MMPVNTVLQKIDDDHQIDVLGSRFHQHVVELPVARTVAAFNQLVVRRVLLQATPGDFLNLGPDVDDVRGGFAHFLHWDGDRRLELRFREQLGQHFRSISRPETSAEISP